MERGRAIACGADTALDVGRPANWLSLRARLRLLGWKARVAVLVCALPLALRWMSVARLARALTPRERRPQRALPAEMLPSLAVWVDRVVDLRPLRFWGHCMRRTLALYYVARRSGYPVRIVFGVRRMAGDKLSGHGWLELDGTPFLEPGAPPEEMFTVMWRLS